jgi:hypothetical protein
MTITEATPMKDRPLIASLMLVIQRENELRGLYAALGLEWGVDSQEDAVAVAGHLLEAWRASE